MRSKKFLQPLVESLEGRRLLSTVVLGFAKDYAVGVYPDSLTAADVTADGIPDLIAAKVQGKNSDLVSPWSKISSFTTVADAAPIVAKISNRTTIAAATFSTSGSFTDPDDFDRWTGLVEWGDGTAKRSLTLQSNKRFSLAHVFSKAGTFTVNVAITDRYGKSASRTFTVKVTK